MLGNFPGFFCCLLTFFKINFFNFFFISAILSECPNAFDQDLTGLIFCQSGPGFKLFAKVISRQQESSLARKELYMFKDMVMGFV